MKEAIVSREYFIMLVGPSTFDNDSYVPNELMLARSIETQKRVIPVWHNGFNPSKHLPDDLSQELRDEIIKTNAIKVEAENPKQYNAALDELLSIFGIAP